MIKTLTKSIISNNIKAFRLMVELLSLPLVYATTDKQKEESAHIPLNYHLIVSISNYQLLAQNQQK
jgi:predicted PolB exonuclease-like 3'-5' exonuclease